MVSFKLTTLLAAAVFSLGVSALAIPDSDLSHSLPAPARPPGSLDVSPTGTDAGAKPSRFSRHGIFNRLKPGSNRVDQPTTPDDLPATTRPPGSSDAPLTGTGAGAKPGRFSRITNRLSSGSNRMKQGITKAKASFSNWKASRGSGGRWRDKFMGKGRKSSASHTSEDQGTEDHMGGEDQMDGEDQMGDQVPDELDLEGPVE